MKPLIEQPGPIVMDRDGYRYHFECWRNVNDRGRKNSTKSDIDQDSPPDRA